MGSGMAESPSGLVHVTHEGLPLVNGYVWIADECGQLVDDVATRQPLVAPVPRHADLVHEFAVDGERTQPTGDESLGADGAPGARDRDPVQVRDLLLGGERIGIVLPVLHHRAALLTIERILDR